MVDGEEHGEKPSPDQLSRRALLRRAGQGAMVAGLAAWVVPEVIVAAPASAQPLSGPPSGGGGGGGPSTGPGTGGGGSPTGPGAGGGGPFAGPGNGGGQAPGGAPSTATAGSATGSTGALAATAGSGSGHGSLAFTGFDPDVLLGIGATLVAGGWTINRWASRQEGVAEAEPSPADRQPS